MEPHYLDLFKLFNAQQRYVMPLFQRPYVWNQERHWEPLWNDVADRAQAVITDWSSVNGKDARRHFLGAVVLEPLPRSPADLPGYSVIDGQQRLTTLQTLLAALRDTIATGVNDTVDPKADWIADLSSMTTNPNRRGVQSLKILPTNADRETYSAVHGAGGREQLEAKYPATHIPVGSRKARPLERPKLVLAYLYFCDAIEAFVSGSDERLPQNTDSRTDRFNALVYALKELMAVVTITLSEKDDAQIIFETLNDRGEPLLAGDLARNYVFIQVSRHAENDLESVYERYWRRYDQDEQGNESFWKRIVLQGRQKRVRFDLFLFHFLTAQLGEEFPLSHTFDRFKAWWNSSSESAEVNLDRLARSSQIARIAYAPERNHDPVHRFARRLEDISNTTAIPLLLYLMGDALEATSRAAVLAMLADFESYLIRRYVVGWSVKAYNRTTVTLIKNLRARAARGALDASSLREELLNLQGDSQAWPTRAQLEGPWLREASYEKLKTTGVRAVLEGIEEALHGAKQESVILEKKLSIEHVLPQSWTTFWDAPDPSLATRDEDAIVVRNRLLHSFGNLTLVTSPLNTSLKNSAFPTKRVALLDNTLLRMNREFSPLSQWDESAIETRGRHLLETFLEVWPHGAESAPK